MLPALLLAATLAAQAGGGRAATPVVPRPAPAAPATTPAAPPQPLTAWPFRFSDDDYPAAALRGDHQGTVRYRVEIGPEGRVAGCTIIGSSGSGALDSATCRIVSRRGRFTPARDSAGAPVPDAREGEVTWRMDEDE